MLVIYWLFCSTFRASDAPPAGRFYTFIPIGRWIPAILPRPPGAPSFLSFSRRNQRERRDANYEYNQFVVERRVVVVHVLGLDHMKDSC